MKINMQLVHYLVLIFGALAVSLPQLTKTFPPSAAPWILAAASVFALLNTVLAVITQPAVSSKNGSNGNGSGGGTTTIRTTIDGDPDRIARMMPKYLERVLRRIPSTLLLFLMSAFLALPILGCTAQQAQAAESKVPTIIDDVGLCVLDHPGDSVEQLLLECAPEAAKDALAKEKATQKITAMKASMTKHLGAVPCGSSAP